MEASREAHCFGLSGELLAAIRQMAKSCGIAKLWLFGSRARGDYRPRSDIDLAVQGGNTTEFAVSADELLPTLLLFDVVNLDHPVQQELRDEIAKDGVLLYEKDRSFRADAHQPPSC